jgi:predicted nucleic acid-binding protein
MRVALDTNILAYAEGIGDQARLDASLTLLGQLPQERVLLPAQTLGELYRVLTGKAQWEHLAAREAILTWGDSFGNGGACRAPGHVLVDTLGLILAVVVTAANGDDRQGLKLERREKTGSGFKQEAFIQLASSQP